MKQVTRNREIPMKKPIRFSIAMLISAAALSAAVSAQSVFAEENHGGRHGRGSDDVVTVAAPGTAVIDDDLDVNDDRGVDAVAAPAAPGVATVTSDDLIDD
jgi:hypothetical protein